MICLAGLMNFDFAALGDRKISGDARQAFCLHDKGTVRHLFQTQDPDNKSFESDSHHSMVLKMGLDYPLWRAACATATPRSRTNFTASSLNSRLNFRRCIYTLRFRKHLISVSTKSAAAQVKLLLAQWRSWSADKQLAIEAFIDAWFELVLVSDLAEADEGWISWDAERVFCGAARAGLPLECWLSRLTEPDATPVLVEMQRRFRSKPLGFWEDAPGAFYEVKAFLNQDRK